MRIALRFFFSSEQHDVVSITSLTGSATSFGQQHDRHHVLFGQDADELADLHRRWGRAMRKAEEELHASGMFRPPATADEGLLTSRAQRLRNSFSGEKSPGVLGRRCVERVKSSTRLRPDSLHQEKPVRHLDEVFRRLCVGAIR